MNKIYTNLEKIINDVKPNDSILIGGFGLCGLPENLIETLNNSDINDLILYTQSGSTSEFGIGKLINSNKIKKIICPTIGANKVFESKFFTGEIEVELVPQGTFVEQIRAGSAGLGGFYTKIGIGTFVEKGGLPTKYDNNGNILKKSEPREVKKINGEKYVLEYAIKTKFALIKAWKSDKFGNLIFRKTARNYNEDMAKAAEITIVEVEEIVENGTFNPDEIHVPGIYINRIIKGEKYEKPIKKIIVSTKKNTKSLVSDIFLKRVSIAKRTVKLLKENQMVNLGVGIPTLVANFIPKELNITFQCENGVLGIGPYPDKNNLDADLINASKEPITFINTSSTFSFSEAFLMIRGGHLDVTVLGSMQVDESGSFANFFIPDKKAIGPGGAMDLATSTKKVIIAMMHTTTSGEPKILQKCTLPLTAINCVDAIVTELCIMEMDYKRHIFVLTHIAKGITLEEIKQKTKANIDYSRFT